MKPLLLLPTPQSIEYTEGQCALENDKFIAIDSPAYLFAAERLQTALKQSGINWHIIAYSDALPSAEIGVRFSAVDQPVSGVSSDKEGYRIEVGGGRIQIIGKADAPQTVWWGVCTLMQILAQHQQGEPLPALTIRDWPDFPRRGVMLDITRDKVPTMQTLYALIDRLALWKINEVQLYTEHTFAYRNHPIVWRNASPMTGEEIMQLDRFCRDRYIDLVPNQNSFGHMHRWLMHDEYRHLAEIPEGLDWPLFISKRPFSIAPTDPGSLELIKGLYDELLPHFTSRYFNVGCDETADLGKGRSKEACDAQGKSRVYLEFLKQIAELTRSHGRIMQFWGDIIMEHPELVPELPKDLIAMEWGYEANHPFEQDGARFAASGIQFYVCPGTSSWLSLVGRTQNAVGNLRSAATNGLKHGAIGYLNTDWGDFGHWQPLPVSYLGFAYGAALSWATQQNLDLDIPTVLSTFAFEDPTGKMGQLAYDLGNLYLKAYPQHNSALPVRALFSTVEQMHSGLWATRTSLSVKVDPAQIRQVLVEAEQLEAALNGPQPADAQVIPDYKLAIGLWKHGCKRLLLAFDDSIDQRAMVKTLLDELRGLHTAFREQWLARNRPGGMDDSLVRMQRLFTEYEA